MLKNWLCKMLATRFVTLDSYEIDEKEQNDKLAALEKRLLTLKEKDVPATVSTGGDTTLVTVGDPVSPLAGPRSCCTTGFITLTKEEKSSKTKKKAAK